MFCRCPTACVCFGPVIDCAGSSVCQNNKSPLNTTGIIMIPSTTRVLDVSYNGYIYEQMNLGQSELVMLVRLNLSYCNIEGFPSNFFSTMSNLKVLDISHNRIKRLTTHMFLYQSELEVLKFDENSETLVFETEAFTGLALIQKLSFSKLDIERIFMDTFANLNLEELSIYHSTINLFERRSFGSLQAKRVYLNSTKIKVLSENMFGGISGIHILITDEPKFCCERPSTLSSDNCFPQQDEFSSCGDLVRNEVLIPLIWIIGFFSILANAASLAYRITKQKKQFKRNYGIFVSHLAVSDGLMGVYLLIIAAADSYYRGSYIYHDDYWRFSTLCQVAGVVSVISSEASVLFISLILVDRFLVVKYPFGQVKIDLKLGKRLCFIVWVIVVFVGLLPIGLYPVFKGQFYSISGTCLSLPITRVKPPGWQFAFGIFIVFNLISCMVVGFGQLMIYKQIKEAAKKMTGCRSGRTYDTRVTKNLLVVVTTNVLCWLPIIIFGKYTWSSIIKYNVCSYV